MPRCLHWLQITGIDERDVYDLSFIVKRDVEIQSLPLLKVGEPYSVSTYEIVDFREHE